MFRSFLESWVNLGLIFEKTVKIIYGKFTERNGKLFLARFARRNPWKISCGTLVKIKGKIAVAVCVFLPSISF